MKNPNSTKSYVIQISSIIFVALMLGFIFSDALIEMLKYWERDEYSHGYLIPVISIWFIWQNIDEITKVYGKGNWYGLPIIIFGLFLAVAGSLATLYIIVQYAFLITLFGICLAYTGIQGIKILWFPLFYLVFMIPLPSFLYNNLSSELQLISSQLGVHFIRLFDISVNLQGNVIDLGNYQLQVVEACNGLRYLFPLSSFSFLCAYFFRSKLWIRGVIFLSSLPITVIMNSFRIGVIGVLVEYWGIEMAEGFLHDFEGWVIFIACIGILFIEMWLLCKLFIKDKSFNEVFIISGQYSSSAEVEKHSNSKQIGSFSLPPAYLMACVVLLVGVVFTIFSNERQEIIPNRQKFVTFPLEIEDWKGFEIGMEKHYVDALKFDDYIIANYITQNDNTPVNFYIAYYASQRKGASAHSPKSCLPGDGWRISQFEQKEIPSVDNGQGKPLVVNRAVITKGNSKQLVYYWFQQRGRNITNEYLVKWYLFWDSLTRQRTDGALVRLVVNVPNGVEIQQSDKKMENFLQKVVPVFSGYLPS